MKKIIVAFMSLSLVIVNLAWAENNNINLSNSGRSENVAAEVQEYKSEELLIAIDGNYKEKADQILENNGFDVVSSEKISGEDAVMKAKLPSDYSVERAKEKAYKLLKRKIKSSSFVVQPNFAHRLHTSVKNRIDKVGHKKSSAGDYTWWLNKINYNQAETYIPTGKKKVRVGVIDTGADINHPAIRSAIDRKYSKKIVYKKMLPLKKDTETHGTHVTGIIAGRRTGSYNNWSGVASKVANIVALDASTYENGTIKFYTYELIRALSYCRKIGCKVINMSLGGGDRDYLVEREIKKTTAAGVVVVVSAGNDGSSKYNAISDAESVVSVINTTVKDKRAFDSNYGYRKDISAPGSNIFSCIPGKKYEFYSGTSMAAPIVTGTVATMLYNKPNLTPKKIKSILYSSSKDIGAKGFDKYSGFGRVDMYKAHRVLKNLNIKGKVDKIKTNIKRITMQKLQTYTIDHAVESKLGENIIPDMYWKSNDRRVAVIDGNGILTAKKRGTAYILGSCGGMTAKIKVEVRNPYSRVNRFINIRKSLIDTKKFYNYYYKAPFLGYNYYGRKGETVYIAAEGRGFNSYAMILNYRGEPFGYSYPVFSKGRYTSDEIMAIRLPYTGNYYIQLTSEGGIRKGKRYRTRFTLVSNRHVTKPRGYRYSRSISIRWNRLKNASGYIIKRRVGRGRTRTYKRVRGYKTNRFIDRRIRRNKTYTYSIYPYVNVLGGKTKFYVGRSYRIFFRR